MLKRKLEVSSHLCQIRIRWRIRPDLREIGVPDLGSDRSLKKRDDLAKAGLVRFSLQFFTRLGLRKQLVGAEARYAGSPGTPTNCTASGAVNGSGYWPVRSPPAAAPWIEPAGPRWLRSPSARPCGTWRPW
jgi:hypothetical protein